MGLPINFARGSVIAEPQPADEGFVTIPLGIEGAADSFYFADTLADERSDGIISGSSALRMEGAEVGIANGLAIEGVEVGIAAPSDQDLLTSSQRFTPQDTSESSILTTGHGASLVPQGASEGDIFTAARASFVPDDASESEILTADAAADSSVFDDGYAPIDASESNLFLMDARADFLPEDASDGDILSAKVAEGFIYQDASESNLFTDGFDEMMF